MASQVLDTVAFPEYQSCGGKLQNGTRRDFMQQLQPLDCTYVLLNGAYQPEIGAVAGVMQRWRFVQSSHQSSIIMLIDGCEAVVLARDGIYLPARMQVRTI